MPFRHTFPLLLSLAATVSCTNAAAPASRVLDEEPNPCGRDDAFPEEIHYAGEGVVVSGLACHGWSGGDPTFLAMEIAGVDALGAKVDLVKEGFVAGRNPDTWNYVFSKGDTRVEIVTGTSVWTGEYLTDATLAVDGPGTSAKVLLREGTPEELSERAYCAKGFRPSRRGAETFTARSGNSLTIEVESCISTMSMGGVRVVPMRVTLEDPVRGIREMISHGDARIGFIATHHNEQDALLLSFEKEGFAYAYDSSAIEVSSPNGTELYLPPASSISGEGWYARMNRTDFDLASSPATHPVLGDTHELPFVSIPDNRPQPFVDTRSFPSALDFVNRVHAFTGGEREMLETYLVGKVILAPEARIQERKGLLLVSFENLEAHKDRVNGFLASFEMNLGYNDRVAERTGRVLAWPSSLRILIGSEREREVLREIDAASWASRDLAGRALLLSEIER